MKHLLIACLFLTVFNSPAFSGGSSTAGSPAAPNGDSSNPAITTLSIPAPTSETRLFRYDGFYTQWFGSDFIGNANYQDQTTVECGLNQNATVSAWINKIAPAFGKDPTVIQQELNLIATTVITTTPIMSFAGGGLSGVSTQYNYSCSSDLVSNSQTVSFLQDNYDITAAKNDTQPCAQLQDQIRVSGKGYLNGSIQTFRQGDIFHRTFFCRLTTMSLDLQ